MGETETEVASAVLKRVRVERLKAGMFVVDLNAGWMGHPFVRNQLRISNDDILLIHEQGIKEVTIDSNRGVDADAPTLDVVQEKESKELVVLAEQEPIVVGLPLYNDESRAKAAVEKAVEAVVAIMDDAKMGNPIDLSVLQRVAEAVVKEVVNNPATAVTVYHLHKTCEYTYAHSIRVAVMLVSCAHRMGLPEKECAEMALGGMIHDIGKMCVKREILLKPAKLTDVETDHMRTHVTLGSGLIKEGRIPRAAMSVLLEHHERFDGKGYPGQLSGEDISVAGRIAAIADVYDAISSDRWYHKGLPPAASIRKIHEWSKHHFDPIIAAHFIRAIGIYPVGSLVRLSNRRLAVVVEHQQRSPLHPKVRPVFDLRTKRILDNAIELNLADRRHITIEGHENPSEWGIDPGDYL